MKVINQPNLTGLAKITRGSYLGNATEERAIPHGLGRMPKVVFIVQYPGDYTFQTMADDWLIFYQSLASMGCMDAPSYDADNFYVGNADNYYRSANYNGLAYYWIAIG